MVEVSCFVLFQCFCLTPSVLKKHCWNIVFFAVCFLSTLWFRFFKTCYNIAMFKCRMAAVFCHKLLVKMTLL